MFARTLALTCACLLGLAAGASAQTQSATPPAATPPAPTPPAATSPAVAAPPTRIRGTIAAVAPHLLTVNSRDGTKVEVALSDPLTVVTLTRVPLASIAEGSYLGVATRNGPHGTPEAIEVLVFPEAMRGAGAGHYAWDLQPGSMMTNAPVTAVVKGKSGRDLTLTYKDGNVTIHVPPKAPVVTFVPATAADLKPGRKVFLVATKSADGHLTAARVTVGTHGVNPPM